MPNFWAVIVDIELDDSEFVLVLVSNLIEQRCDHLARPAPFSPKIDQYGLFVIRDVGIEIAVRGVHYLVAHRLCPPNFSFH